MVDGLSHHLLPLPYDDSSDPIHLLSSPFPLSFILHSHPSHFLLTSFSPPPHFYGQFSLHTRHRGIWVSLHRLAGIDILLRNYQESCQQAPKLKHQSSSTESNVRWLQLTTWCCSLPLARALSQIARSSLSQLSGAESDRLGIEPPFAMFLDHRHPDGFVVSGRRKTYAWLESQPMDHVYQGHFCAH